MPSEDWSGKRLETRALDILEAIGRIREYVAGMDFRDYIGDQKTQSATERELEKISEACARIPTIENDSNVPERRRLENRFPDIPWVEIRGIGNRLRHEYGRVDPQVIWKTVAGSDDLEKVERALKRAFPGLTGEVRDKNAPK